MESAAATRPMTTKPRRHGGWSPGLLGVILILIAIHGALVWWRSEIVRLLPQTASLYAAIGLPVNLRGLDITDVQTVTNRQDGIGLLVVEGKIVNTTSRTIDVPRVYFSVRDERGLEIYRWTASTMKAPIEPGETVPFRSRLASPPPETNRVFVRFRNRRDLVVGMN